MDGLSWELRVPIFKNGLILKQMGIAIGIPFGALTVFLIIIKAYYALILIGATFLLAFLLIMLLFRGSYDVRYVLNGQEALCQTQADQKKRVQRLASLTFLLGLLRGNPTAAGSGLLSASNTGTRIPWKRVRKLKYMEKQKIIRLYGGFGESMVLFCTDENYMQVKQYINKFRGDAQ